MGSTIQGPIIQFRMTFGDSSSQLNAFVNQMKSSMGSASTTMSAQWQQMAAKIRAGIDQELIGTKSVGTARQNLIGLLNTEIGALRTKSDLTKAELSSLKQMTLEYERQTDALVRNSKIGITAGTSEALGRVGSGLGSAANLFGGAGISSLASGFGAMAQVAQALGTALGKVGTISAEAAEKTGSLEKSLGGVGAAASGLANAEKPITAIGTGAFGAETEVGLFSSGIVSAGTAVAGFAAVLAGLAVTGGLVTKAFVEQNESIENTAAATGLTSKEVQTYAEISKQLGLDAGSTVQSFARLQAQLGEYVLKSGSADAGTSKFATSLQKMGVAVTDGSNSLRPIGDIIADFKDKLDQIPDVATRSAVAYGVMGARMREFAPILLRTNVNIREMSSAIQASGLLIDSNLSAKLDVTKDRMNSLGLASSALFKQMREDISSITIDRILPNVDQAKIAAAQSRAQAQDQADQIKTNASSIFAGIPKISLVDTNADMLNLVKTLQAAGAAVQMQIQTTLREQTAALQAGHTNAAADYGARVAALQSELGLMTQIEKLRKPLADALAADDGAGALKIQNQIAGLETALSFDQRRLATNDSLLATMDAMAEAAARNGNAGPGVPLPPFNPRIQELNKIAGGAQGIGLGPNGAPNILPNIDLSGTLSSSSAAALASIKAVTTDAGTAFNNLKDSINQDYTATFASGTQKILNNLATLENQLNLYAIADVSRAQDVANLKIEAEKTAQAQILQLQDDAMEKSLEKARNEAGQLFDALLTGNSKKISQSFQKTFEEIATAPIKQLFSSLVSALILPLDNSITHFVGPLQKSIDTWIKIHNPQSQGGGAGAGTGSGGGIALPDGTIIDSGVSSPGGMIYSLQKALGLNAHGGHGAQLPGTSVPQIDIAQATLYVQRLSITASTVNLTTGATVPQSPISTSLDGAPNPRDWFSGADSFSGMNLMPALGAAAAGLSLGPALSALPSLTATLQNGIAQLQNGNAVSTLSAMKYGIQSPTGGPLGGGSSSGTSGMSGAASWMQAAAGGLMVYEASRHGGVGGAITGGIGGAELGAKIGSLFTPIFGPAGPIAGALIGGLGGLLTGVFGHKDRTAAFEAAVKTAGYNEQYHAPPPETFSFAEGSTFAQTMASTFSQAGTSFAKVALPNGTPFWMSAILGPLSTKNINGQPSQAQLYNNLNNGLPFFGAPTYGLGPRTLMPPITQTNLPPGTHQSTINFTLPPSLTQSSSALLGMLVQGMLPHLNTALGRSYSSSNSSLAVRARRANNLP